MALRNHRSSHLWLGALVATLLLQATAAFLTRLVPTIAPAMLPGLGWSDTAIGYLAAATTAGSIAFLLTRSLQAKVPGLGCLLATTSS